MADFSPYLANLITEWMSQNTQMATPPGTVYVTVFDDTGTEVDGSFTNMRAAVDAPTEWTQNGTDFENGVDIDLGEAATTVENLTDVALYDAETGGNELARYEIDQAPFNVAEGSTLTFLAGELTFDVVDNTEV